MSVFDSLRLNQSITDDEFDAIYPSRIRKLAGNHFTPVDVAIKAAQYLVTTPGTKVLDIGSGAGKFCMIGATCTTGHFSGIEQRSELVELSKRLAIENGLSNVSFIKSNITAIEFSEFNGVYIYNSFQENIDGHNRMDNTVLLNPTLYNAYTTHTSNQLSSLKSGTRLVTYYTSDNIVPSDFSLVDSQFDDRLKFWAKIK